MTPMDGKPIEAKTGAQRKAESDERERAALGRIGMGPSELWGIINGMNADQLGMLRAMLADAKAGGGK